MATSIFTEYFKGYEVLGELGRGNARVVKARNRANGELVAIKHFAFNTNADTLRRFQRESEIMKSIEHHFVVKILEVHLDAELPYIVMQLVEGGDLRSLLKSYETLDVATVISLAHHMTEALDAIHAKGIIHRDLKPENIMYRKSEAGETQFLLTDFGIARLREQADSITITGASMLTYDYASPEQFNQSKTIAAATDYYSLGVVLYECLTGSVPFEFEQDDLLMHINRVISCPLPLVMVPAHAGYGGGNGNGAGLPPSLLQLLEGLMHKQAAHRISDPGRVRHLLKMAAIEDLQGINNNAGSQASYTIAYHSADGNAVEGKRKRGPAILVLLLAGIALVYSQAHFARRAAAETPGPVVQTAGLPLALETKQVLPPGNAHVVHMRRTPAVNNGPANTASSSPGVALVNGMYYNDFEKEDSSWATGADANSEFILLDGKYTMKGFTDSLSYSSSLKLNMDTDRDFSVAAVSVHQGEGSADPFGIIFCGDEAQDAFFVFYITSNGYYSIGSSVGDQWNALVDWTASSNIRQNDELNVFSVEKRGHWMRFLVNDRVEKTLPMTVSYGSCFGLRIDGAQTVAFDQFVVKGFKPSEKSY